jgi:hypothetical protein
MFCPECGNNATPEDRFCPVCGREAAGPAAQSFASSTPTTIAGAPTTERNAIISLIFSLFFLFPPFSIVAIIFGYLSLSEIRRSAGRLKGRALAITGVVLGYAGVAVITALIIWAVVGWQAERKAASKAQPLLATPENSAVAALRTLNTAEIAYAQAHPDAGYTCSLSELAAAWGISGELAHGRKEGYLVKVQGCSAAKTDGPIVKYQLVAYPEDKVGKPAFCSNESDVIKIARNGNPHDCLSAGVNLSVSEINRPQIWTKTSPR